MSTKPKPPRLNKEASLRNTKVDKQVVAAHERLEEKLLKLGVEIKPSYSLEHPLAKNRARAHSLNR